MPRKKEKIVSTPLTGGVSAIALALAASLFGATGSRALPISVTEAVRGDKLVVLVQLRLGTRNNRRTTNARGMTIKKIDRRLGRTGAAALKSRRLTMTGAKAKRAARSRKVTRKLGRPSKLSISKMSGPNAARLRKLGKAKKTIARVKPKTGAGTPVRTTRKLPNIHAARKKGKGLAILATNRRSNLSSSETGKVKFDLRNTKKFSDRTEPVQENSPRQADRLKFLKLLGVNARPAKPAADAAPPVGPVPIPYPVFGSINALEPGRSNSTNGKPIAVKKIVPADKLIERGVPFGHTIGILHEHQNPQSSTNPSRTRFLAIHPHGSPSKSRDFHQYGGGLTDFIFAPNQMARSGVRHQRGRVIMDADLNEVTPGGGGYNEIFFDDKSGGDAATGLKKEGLPLSGKYSGTYLVKGVSHLTRQTGKKIKTDTTDSHDRYANTGTSYLFAPDTEGGSTGKPLLIVAEDVEGEAIATLIVNLPYNGKKDALVKATADLTTNNGTSARAIVPSLEPIIMDEPTASDPVTPEDQGDPGGTGEAPCPDPLDHAPGC